MNSKAAVDKMRSELAGLLDEARAETHESSFTDEQLAGERVAERAGVNQPGFDELSAHMKRFGPDGILESAAHLPAEDYGRLAQKAKQMKFDKKTKKWVA